MVAPINSIKHFVQRPNTSVLTGTITNFVIVDAVAAPANTFIQDVIQGSIIKAIHHELWIANGGPTNQTTQVVITVEKKIAGSPVMTFAQSLNLSGYLNKKNILHTFQGILAPNIDGANPIQPLPGWILIPKGKQRMGLGDQIVINISSVTQAIQTCGMFIYKEYR